MKLNIKLNLHYFVREMDFQSSPMGLILTFRQIIGQLVLEIPLSFSIQFKNRISDILLDWITFSVEDSWPPNNV